MRAHLALLALALASPIALAAAPTAAAWILVVTPEGWEARPAGPLDARTECGGAAPAVSSCEASAVRTGSDWAFGMYAPAWGTLGTGFFEARVALHVSGSDGRHAYMDCPVFVGAGGVARGFCEAGGNPFPGVGALVRASATVASIEGTELEPMGEWRAFIDV